MSLISSEMDKCIVIDIKTVPDGFGGLSTEYVNGAEFMAAVVYDGSREMTIAKVDKAVSTYSIYTNKNVGLTDGMIIKRLEDKDRSKAELTLKITSNGSDFQTPRAAGLQLRCVSAKPYEIGSVGVLND